MGLILYTAIFGDVTDQLRPPQNLPRDPGARFICFSDRSVTLPPWQILPAVRTAATPRRTARLHKVLAHQVLPEHTISIWVDGCLSLRTAPHIIAHDALVGGGDMTTFKHPKRSCVYREYEACRRMGKDDAATMLRQIEMYQFVGYPMNNGLAETACLVRRNSSQTCLFNEAWWTLIDEYSHRDQLSFDFAAWRTGMPYHLLPGCRDRSLYFSYHPHVTRRVRR